MSQRGQFLTGSQIGPIDTITGNTGGPVGPDGSGNINIVGAGNITVAGNAGTNTETISITGIIPIANGGTNAGSFSTVDGTVYYDGTRLVTTATGIAGQVLTSNGAGVAPTYQAAGASSISITGDTGGALIGNAFTFTAGTTGLSFGGAGTTETLSGVLAIANGGTNASSMTVTDGTVYFDGTRLVTTATGTLGQVLTSGGVGVAPAYAALPTSVTSITAGLNISVTGTATVPIVSESQAQYLTNYSVANATPYVVTATDFYITVDTSTIPITIQLPDAPTIYRRFVIKDSAGNAGTQNVTVTTVSGVKLIDGAATFVMNTNYEAIELVYDNFGYQVF